MKHISNKSTILKKTDHIPEHLWQRPHPFYNIWTIGSEDIDHYQHVNNVAYVSRLEKLAWQHSSDIGLTLQDYQRLDRAMVIQQHMLNYHLPAHLGDELACATWIVLVDGKFRLNREFQFINVATLKTVFSATTKFVCCTLSSGRPKVMPNEFFDIYSNAVTKEHSFHGNGNGNGNENGNRNE